jgi:hypothetical protein
MTLEQIVAAIRSLPVRERLRVIEQAAHDVANDVSGGAPLAGAGGGVSLVERGGFPVAHGESREALPLDAFDHRPAREGRADALWGDR